MLLSMYEDAVEEFKKSGPGGKIAIVAIFILVAGIGFYEYKKHSSGISGASSPSTDTAGTPASGMLGSTPIIPPGYNALFDSQGGLIGWQPSASGSSGSVASPPVQDQTAQVNSPGGYRFMQGADITSWSGPTSTDAGGPLTPRLMSSPGNGHTTAPNTQLTPAQKMVG